MDLNALSKLKIIFINRLLTNLTFRMKYVECQMEFYYLQAITTIAFIMMVNFFQAGYDGSVFYNRV
jgi:hypothetical protein